MQRKILMLCVLMGIALMHTGCFLFTGVTTSDNTPPPPPPEPTVDYAPQQMRNGAYFTFTGSQGSNIRITFQSLNTADLSACSASGGRINAAYYHYDGFNMATLTYNYSPNGGVTSQYKAELKFWRQDGGTITFLDTNQTASSTYRP